MTSAQSSSSRHVVGLGPLWFGLFGAAAAWSIQELVSYGLIAHSCFPDWQPRTLPTVSGTWAIALAIGLLMLALGAGGAATAWASWRRLGQANGHQQRHHLEVGEGRDRFMAAGGLVVSGLILYTIALNLIALFLVEPC